MKDTLVCGDSLDWVDSIPDYPASSGFTLYYRLVPRVSGTPILLTSIASGDEHRTIVPAITSGGWTAGDYTWSSWVSDGSTVVTLERDQTVTLLPDPRTIAARDGRSQAMVALDAANAALATYISTGGAIKRYAIGGREVEYASRSDLVKEVSYWQAVVNREQAADAVRKGQADPRRVYLRMGRA